MTDEIIDTVTIAGTPEECRRRLAEYEGVVDEVLFVNVSYSSREGASMLEGYRRFVGGVMPLLVRMRGLW